MSQKVELHTKTLGELFKFNQFEGKQFEGNLSIPDYQRIYCWEDNNVLKLLDDIKDFSDKKYHLGSIILHKRENNQYDIVDGQQRLVTLSLLLLHINNSLDFPLSNAKFTSNEAQDYLSYNKWIIQNYYGIDELKKEEKVNQMLENLQFSVLIIEDESIDLAYTFFSNQNSRGKSLTDYDLLKAHHLRFIHIPEQANHMAERWDNLILSSDNDSTDKDLARTFGIYLFRLRKWMRKREWSNDAKFKVKNEFEASPIISQIPPFGEQFKFYESIQGGSHFFAYADFFIYKFKTFSETTEYKSLKDNLSWETHWWYRDIIEAFLFAYYLKFGTIYLSDALIGIIKIISEHRFENGRSNFKSLLKFAADSEIILMIDQATSPTFFLAEMSQKNKKNIRINGESLGGIRDRYLNNVNYIFNKLKENTTISHD